MSSVGGKRYDFRCIQFQTWLALAYYQAHTLSPVWLFLAPDNHTFYQSGYDVLQWEEMMY